MCCAKNVIDQKEYLKKYLSGVKKKKKRDKKRKNDNQMNIIDDNVFASGDIKIDEELLLTGEEAPQIVGEVWEEQPIAPKVEKWRSIIIKDEPEDDDKKTHVKQESNVWGRNDKNEFSEKLINIKSEQETLPNRERKRVQGSDSDLSPPRRGRKELRRDSDSDLSIPGRKRRNSNDSDLSLPRARRKQTAADGEYSDSDGDLALPRQRNKVRRERRIQSPVLISKITNSNSDLLTKKKREVKSSWRASPVEIKREKIRPTKSPTAVHRKSRWGSERQERTVSPPPTHKIKATLTLEGKKAGLQNAEAMKAENEARRQMEKRMFDNMPKDISGRDAEVGVRSSGRRGKRARDAEEEDPEEMRRREERELEKKEIYDRWGKGLKQVEDRRTQLQEEAYESSKPLARSRDDADLDKYYRDQERLEDPMLEYMREKKRERMKELNIPVMPKYEGSYPENRFTIRPGYRWDGVDRSNGYEKRWFEVRNERKAREEEAYKYSVEDM